MTTVHELLKRHVACAPGLDWFQGLTPEHQEDKAWLWANAPDEYFVWAALNLGFLHDKTLRILACKFVRLTPIGDGRTVWDLLTDRSRNAVLVSERFAAGEATEAELDAELDAAWAVWDLTADAAWDAAWDAARDVFCEMVVSEFAAAEDEVTP